MLTLLFWYLVVQILYTDVYNQSSLHIMGDESCYLILE